MTNNQSQPQLEKRLENAPERIWIVSPVEFKSLISKSGPAFTDDVEYVRADLLQQPTSSERSMRCVECKHVKLDPWRGYCQHEVSPFGKRPVRYCGHSCKTFEPMPSTSERCIKCGHARKASLMCDDDDCVSCKCVFAATGAGEEAQREGPAATAAGTAQYCHECSKAAGHPVYHAPPPRWLRT